MAVKIQDRPIETVREEVIDQLIMNYSHGEISLEAFERRLDEAMNSTSNIELVELTADLDLTVDQNYVDKKKQDLAGDYAVSGAENVESIINIFSGSKREGRYRVAKEIRLISIFSGATIDFSDAQFVNPVTTIKSFSLFSGDTLYVPENVQVISKVTNILGSVNNKVSYTTDRNGPIIQIEGIAILSEVSIEIKRTLKEKFVAFADGLKRMIS